MPLINIPGPAEKLRKLYSLQAPPATALAPEVVPVVVVDDASQVRINPSDSERPCIASQRVPAGGAGNFGMSVLRGLTNSKTRIIVDAVQISPTIQDDVQVVVRPGVAVFAPGTAKSFRDLGLDGNPEAVVSAFQAAGAFPGQTVARWFVNLDPRPVALDIELGNSELPPGGPGDFIAAGPSSGNIAFDITWWWRELPPFG